MSQKMWKHRCSKDEAMAPHQSKYGLKPIGSHRKVAQVRGDSRRPVLGESAGRGSVKPPPGEWGAKPGIVPLLCPLPSFSLSGLSRPSGS